MNSIGVAILAMVFFVTLSNQLVEVPINAWMTWGVFIYPFTYLVTELTNRLHGPQKARKVVYCGFVMAAILSFFAANKRIAAASLIAFLVSQCMDISIFSRLRRQAWWLAPAVASVIATFVDTVLFFFLGFFGTDFPWVTVAMGDYGIKVGMDLALLLPFRVVLWNTSTDSS